MFPYPQNFNFHLHHQQGEGNNMQQHPLTFLASENVPCVHPFRSVIITYAQTSKYSRWAICNQPALYSRRRPGSLIQRATHSLTHTAHTHTFFFLGGGAVLLLFLPSLSGEMNNTQP